MNLDHQDNQGITLSLPYRILITLFLANPPPFAPKASLLTEESRPHSRFFRPPEQTADMNPSTAVSHFQRRRPAQKTAFMAPETPQRTAANETEDSSPTEFDNSQMRFKFTRKKRESKTSNLLVIEAAQPQAQIPGSRNHKLSFMLKKSDDNGLQTMNDMLEQQKELEIQRFLYRKYKGILDLAEESNWKGEEADFKEENEFENRYGLRDELKKGSCFLEVVEMSEVERKFVDLELVDKRTVRYRLTVLWLTLRRKTSNFCYKIVKHPLFEPTTLLVTTLNCIAILIDNSSLTGGAANTTPFLLQLDNFFFAFYISELSIKVLALGFVMNEGAYLKDGWNFLDFFIIITALINKITAEYQINLKALRSLRVLRPLKVIATIKKLQVILESLFQALPLLADSFLILTFCYLLYALAGLQLFPGLLKKRCIYKDTGLTVFTASEDDVLCGNFVCSEDQFCGKQIENPNSGIMNFDNIFYSFLNVFQIVTVDNWTSIMYSLQKTFTNYISVYFLSLVIIGGLFLVNLTLAIIKVKFSSLSMTNHQGKHKKKIVKTYDFLQLKEKHIWICKRPLFTMRSMTREKSTLLAMEKSSLAMEKSSLAMQKSSLKGAKMPSAKTSKRSNNPFSMHLLSQLRLEIGKLANNVSSYALELGKATKNLGKSVGVKIMGKLSSPLRLFRKNDPAGEDSDNKRLEMLEPRYLKLQIKSSLEYLSESQGDVRLGLPVLEKKKVLTHVLTQRVSRKRYRWHLERKARVEEYRVPSYVKKGPERPMRGLKVALASDRSISLQRAFRGLSPVVYHASPEGQKDYAVMDGKGVVKEKMAVSTAFANSYEDARTRINERLDVINEEKEFLQDRLFNNEGIFEKLQSGSLSRNMWSGNSVMRRSFSNKYQNIEVIIKSLVASREHLFSTGFDLILHKTVKVLHDLVTSTVFDHFIFLVVFLNAVILCLEGAIDDEYLLDFNYFFTTVFTVEMAFKMTGLGIRSYFRDNFNVMDFVIVIFSVSEIVLSKIVTSSFESLRVMRSIRVFRIFRILRRLKFVQKIANFCYKNFSSFIYIACLLLLFNFVYGLLGMDLFTNIKVNDPSLTAYSFNDFSSSFMCAFDLLTLDNWSNILIVGKNSDAGLFQTAIYSISWIFIGNYILMNLFLAVLLDGLTNELIATEISKDKPLSEFELEKAQEQDLKRHLLCSKRVSMVSEKKLSMASPPETLLTQVSQLTSIRELKPNDFSLLMASKCEFSLFIFSRTNYLRKICHFIVFHPMFEIFILLIIVICSCKMVIDTYVDETSLILIVIDNVTTSVFVIECVMKVIAKGFVLHKETYLRESWSQLDFLIVITSIISWVFEQFTVPFIKVIRILRVMRPLRFISKNANIKIVVVALLESLHGILNVFLIILMIFVMFASFGVSIYRRRFGYCESAMNFGVGKGKCPPGGWVEAYTYNFDNIYEAMLTLLVIATYDGWIPILGVAGNSNTQEFGPTPHNLKDFSNVYFVVFIIIIPIFFINLFIGVIFYHFVISEKKTKNIMLTESQIRWIQLQKLILQLEPKYAEMRIPSQPIRRLTYRIVNHRYFEEALLLVICGSVVNMALIYDDCPASYANSIQMVDQVFMLVFVVEILLKLFAFGFRGYFLHRWNQFDFFIVIFGLIDLMINKFFSQQLQVFQVGPKILRAVRMLRIGRLLRLVKKFEGMLKLLQTLIFSLPMTINVLSLLLLIFFIYTIIGCSLFGDVKIDDYVNFKDFLYGMMTLFKMSTTDNWSSTMLAILAHNAYCPIYFVSFIIISQFILTNLFILVLLQQFQESEANNSGSSKSPLQEFNENVDKFRTAWIECTDQYRGQKMKKRHLLKFFRILEPPLGFKDEENIEVIAKFVMEMKIQGDNDGFVYFNELLFKVMRNVYGGEIFETSNEGIINELKKHEKRTTRQLALKQIRRNRAKVTFKGFFHRCRVSRAISYKNKLQVINPLEDYLYIRLCFHSWRKFAFNLKCKAKRCLENEAEMALFYLNSESRESQGLEEEFILSAIHEEEEVEGLPPSPCGKDLRVENMEIVVPENAIKGFSDDERTENRGSGLNIEENRPQYGLPGFIDERRR